MQSIDKKTVLLLVLIGVGTVVAYLPALQSGFIWDDDAYVYENATLRTVGGILDIWFDPFSIPQYYPLVHTTFWIEYRFWGTDPLGYHVDNLLLHLASSVLLLVAVRRLALPGALLAAGAFALHPVMVESVAWVTERKNVLSMLFYLCAAIAYLRYAGLDGRPEPGDGEKRRRWILAFCLFLCALASKSVTFSLPFTLLLIAWWKRGRITMRDVLPLVPFILIGAVYGGFTSYVERYHVGASGAEWDDSLVEKVLVAGRVPWFYLSKLVWPYELTFIYDRWEIDPHQVWQFAFPVATVALIGCLMFVAIKKHIRGPLAAVLMFGGTLFPALGFIDVFPFRYSYVADHFQYHAALGIIVVVSAVCARFVPAKLGVVLATAVFALYGIRTWQQAEKFENKEVLYESILADDPGSFFAYNNLAAIYVEQNKLDKAFEYYKRTQQLRPQLAPSASPEAYAHAKVGSVLAKTHSLKPAIAAADRLNKLRQEAIQAQQMGRPLDPQLVRQQMQNAGEEVIRLRDGVMSFVELAQEHFLEAQKLSPEYAEPFIDYGTLLRALGHVTIEPDRDPMSMFRKAIRSWEHALQVDPKHKRTRVNLHDLHIFLAQVNERMGKMDNAAAHRRSAERIRLADPEPHNTRSR